MKTALDVGSQSRRHEQFGDALHGRACTHSADEASTRRSRVLGGRVGCSVGGRETVGLRHTPCLATGHVSGLRAGVSSSIPRRQSGTAGPLVYSGLVDWKDRPSADAVQRIAGLSENPSDMYREPPWGLLPTLTWTFVANVSSGTQMWHIFASKPPDYARFAYRLKAENASAQSLYSDWVLVEPWDPGTP